LYRPGRGGETSATLAVVEESGLRFELLWRHCDQAGGESNRAPNPARIRRCAVGGDLDRTSEPVCAGHCGKLEREEDPMRIEHVTQDTLSDLDVLFSSNDIADRCWCMWFLIRVADFHAAGREGNRAKFIEMAASEEHPMGLIAYVEDAPVGWCAVGPRSRYARATKAPTLRGREGSDDDVWLVPCFFTHPEHRGSGVAAALLDAALDHSFASGAVAVEGFPLAGDRRRSPGSDMQTGMEPLFASAGFAPHHRPSNNRVIMRKEPVERGMSRRA
jgi:GNAT superfamily N-acetyltransferase